MEIKKSASITVKTREDVDRIMGIINLPIASPDILESDVYKVVDGYQIFMYQWVLNVLVQELMK